MFAQFDRSGHGLHIIPIPKSGYTLNSTQDMRGQNPNQDVKGKKKVLEVEYFVHSVPKWDMCDTTGIVQK